MLPVVACMSCIIAVSHRKCLVMSALPNPPLINNQFPLSKTLQGTLRCFEVIIKQLKDSSQIFQIFCTIKHLKDVVLLLPAEMLLFCVT